MRSFNCHFWWPVGGYVGGPSGFTVPLCGSRPHLTLRCDEPLAGPFSANARTVPVKQIDRALSHIPGIENVGNHGIWPQNKNPVLFEPKRWSMFTSCYQVGTLVINWCKRRHRLILLDSAVSWFKTASSLQSLHWCVPRFHDMLFLS